MAQHLFIVSRQQPDLYSYLSREFSAEPDVTVIVDRRQGERRARQPRPEAVETRRQSLSDAAENRPQSLSDAAENRRQRERRLKAELESNLSTLGYAFVRLA